METTKDSIKYWAKLAKTSIRGYWENNYCPICGVVPDHLVEKVDSMLASQKKEIVEDVKKVFGFPCSCRSKQEVCKCDFSLMKSIVSLIQK